jgi:hypothetical protein
MGRPGAGRLFRSQEQEGTVFGLVIKIALAILALLAGIWMGLPGRYTQTADDIDTIMEGGETRRRKVRRVFTPLAWMQRKISARGPSRPQRRGFKLESPEDR